MDPGASQAGGRASSARRLLSHTPRPSSSLGHVELEALQRPTIALSLGLLPCNLNRVPMTLLHLLTSLVPVSQLFPAPTPMSHAPHQTLHVVKKSPRGFFSCSITSCLAAQSTGPITRPNFPAPLPLDSPGWGQPLAALHGAVLTAALK